MLQRYILVWLVVSSGLAWFWPHTGIDRDPFQTLGAASIQWLILVAMFCVGAVLPTDEVDQLISRWPSVLYGTAVQYLSMPLLAYTAVRILQPSPEIAAGMIIVGCVPGAVASNVLTLTARGNVSFSVSLTTSATLLSPLIVPITLKLALGTTVTYNGGDAVRLLVVQIVLPVLAGHLLSRFCRRPRQIAAAVAPAIANISILTIIAVAVALKRDDVGNASRLIIIPLLMINLLGYAAGYGAAWLLRYPEPMRRALTLEVGMQNAGAGTALAIQLFGPNSAAIIPCVVYTFGCMLTGTTLATLWNRFVPRTSSELNSAPEAEIP